MELDGPVPDGRAKLEAELARIRSKRAAESDPDIAKALDVRIDDLVRQISLIKPKEAEPEADDEIPDFPPATPEQEAQAEALIRQARVAKMRGQTQDARKLLDQAYESAPGSVAVVETLADECAESGQRDKAIKLLKAAMKLNPGNTGLEKKHAAMVFQFKARIEAEMMSSEFMRAEVKENARMAGWWSLILPGLGQIMMNEIPLGISFILAYVSAGIWLIGSVNGFQTPVTAQSHGLLTGSMRIIAPAVVLLALQAIAYSKTRLVSNTFKKEKVSHPSPPVNLPFD